MYLAYEKEDCVPKVQTKRARGSRHTRVYEYGGDSFFCDYLTIIILYCVGCTTSSTCRDIHSAVTKVVGILFLKQSSPNDFNTHVHRNDTRVYAYYDGQRVDGPKRTKRTHMKLTKKKKKLQAELYLWHYTYE